MSAKGLQERIHHYVQRLAVDIGSRPVGSHSNREAQAMIAEEMEAAGIEVETPTFTCLDWRHQEVVLKYRQLSLEALVNPFSPSCDIIEDFIVVKNLDELQAAHCTDKIAVLTGSLSSEAITPKNFPFYNIEEHQLINRCIEDKRPKAVIMVSPKPTPIVPLIEDGDFTIPSVTVPSYVGTLLEQEQQSQIALMVSSQLQTVQSFYPIGRINNGAAKKIVICAHTDTKHYTAGAIDNATGVAALIALAHALKSVSHVDIELVGFNGEDYYSTPSQVHYLSSKAHELHDIELLINIDAIGVRGEKSSIAFFECSDSRVAHIRQMAEVNPIIEETKAWPMGDHMIFAMRGVPCLAFTSTGIMNLVDSVVHTPKDTVDLVDVRSIVQTVEFVRDLVSNI